MAMIPNPKDPLAAPVPMKVQYSSGQDLPTSDLITEALKRHVRALGLRGFIEGLRSADECELKLFAQSLDKRLFPYELLRRYEAFCQSHPISMNGHQLASCIAFCIHISGNIKLIPPMTSLESGWIVLWKFLPAFNRNLIKVDI